MKKFLTFLLLIPCVLCFSCNKKDTNSTSHVSDNVQKSVEPIIGMPNPIKPSSYNEILQTLGVSFSLPQNAQDISFSIISGEIGQAQFSWPIDEQKTAQCCVRVQPTGQIGLQDISGYYYTWKNSANVKVSYNDAVTKWTTLEDGTTVGICIWWDAAPGILYSVSMSDYANEQNLTHLAQLVYEAQQGEVE